MLKKRRLRRQQQINLVTRVHKVQQPMKFEYFFSNDGISTLLVSRSPVMYTHYGKHEGDLNILGSVTSFGEDIGSYFQDFVEGASDG